MTRYVLSRCQTEPIEGTDTRRAVIEKKVAIRSELTYNPDGDPLMPLQFEVAYTDSNTFSGKFDLGRTHTVCATTLPMTEVMRLRGQATLTVNVFKVIGTLCKIFDYNFYSYLIIHIACSSARTSSRPHYYKRRS